MNYREQFEKETGNILSYEYTTIGENDQEIIRRLIEYLESQLQTRDENIELLSQKITELCDKVNYLESELSARDELIAKKDEVIEELVNEYIWNAKFPETIQSKKNAIYEKAGITNEQGTIQVDICPECGERL